MMDQTHVMYYYWQQPMANTYGRYSLDYTTAAHHSCPQDANRHEGASEERGTRGCHENHDRGQFWGLVRPNTDIVVLLSPSERNITSL